MTVDDQLPSADLHVAATNRLIEALAEAENRMSRRVELLADAVIETDPSGAVVFLNPAWESLTGRPAQECLGQPLSSFFADGCRKAVAAALSDTSGSAHEVLTCLEHPDGRLVRALLTASPITRGGTVAVLRDVTREQRDQEELGKLSVVASSTSNMVVITDADGRIDWVNPAFEKRTGYILEEIQGRTPGSFLQGPDTDGQAVGRIRAAIHDHRPITEELLNYTKAGDPYWISLNLTPVFGTDGSLERFISVQADTTERKRMERMKTEFVSTVSHELRTPLTAISGALGLLGAGAAGEMSDQATHLLDLALKNTERLTRLINDLLDMDRMVAGGLPLDTRPQPLMPVIELAVHDNQTFAAKHGVSLCVVEGCPTAVVDIDGLRFGQVMANLISNACKFAPAGTVVAVAVREHDSGWLVEVSDQGPGIPESFRDAIFEKFSQADSSDSRSSGGTGLGLAITKELVERLGGTIDFTSVVGEGTTFRVTLPTSPVAPTGSS